MTDKVQKIKQEIEKELTVLDKTSVYDIGRASELNHLLLFIDSLPEEPASEDLIEEIDKIWKTCNPIDEGMGVETANIHIEQFDDIAHHFAEWQKQQMMKDAVEGEVVYKIGSSVIAPTDIRYKVMSDKVYIPNVKLGDKVKIIIVKEEQQ